MKKHLPTTSLASLLLSIALFGCAEQRASVANSAPFTYPVAARGDQVDDYHGTMVADPYRWLEDPESPATKTWIEAENTLTFAYLESIPERKEIQARLTELWNYERTDAPIERGGLYFFRRNNGLQDQPVLYVTDDLEAEPRILLDPNGLSEDGTIALASFQPSPDGKVLAFGLSDGGSDWRQWHFLEVSSGQRLDDVITRNKFGRAAWSADSNGLYYARYERAKGTAELTERNAPPEICLHRLGTPEEEDELICSAPEDAEIGQGFGLTEDRYGMIVSRWKPALRKNELHWLLLAEGGDGLQPLVTGYDAQYSVVGDDGRNLWVQTDLDAPNGRIVAISVEHPGREHWTELVPETSQAIEFVQAVGGMLVVGYLQDATSAVRIFDGEGNFVRQVELPELGTARGFGGEPEDTETFYSFASFTSPTTVYRYDLSTGKSRVFARPELDFDSSSMETSQVFYTSKDGTRVPMFLTMKRGTKKDGSNPVFLTGYGGFNISITPRFSAQELVWIEMGGIVARPNLRGGGEYGEEWHRAGTKLEKQNVFDDFIAAAEWLIERNYTSPEKLAIEGRSNGGLLVGACITQRPELFGAALPGVGVLDMLRYHEFTIGWAWAGDYGTSADPTEFEALYAYSPLHNVKAGALYPATLVTSADRDDRVVPAHSFKFAAALQEAQAGIEPILIRIETRAGHGAGKPTTMRIEEEADRLAFLVHELGVGE